MNRRAFVVGVVYVCVTSMAGVASRAFADTAFLSAYGVGYVPHFFIALALAFAMATAAYDALARRVRAGVLDATLIVAFGATAAVAYAEPDACHSPAVFVLALLLVGLSSIANLAAWKALTTTVSGRDARRMLPRAGAAVTAGGVAAGFGSSAFIARFGLPRLPIVAVVLVGLMLICALVLPRLVKTPAAPGAAATPAPAPRPVAPRDAMALVRWLVVAALVESVLNSLIEFHFKVAANRTFRADRLGIVLAAFAGGTNSVLLLLQLVAAPRLLVSRSLLFTVSLHPLLVLGSLVGILLYPAGFIASTMTRGVDSVFRGATGRTGQEVSLSALPPGDRDRWKILLRGVITPLGSVAAGGALLLAPTFAAGVPVLAAVALVLLVLQRRAARAYLATLAAPLGMKKVVLTSEMPALRQLDLDELHGLIELAGARDAREAALARALLGRAGHRADELAPHLAHDEAPVRAALFEMASRRPQPEAAAEIRAAVAIEHDDEALAAGLRALAAHGDASASARARALADEGGARALPRAARAYLATIGEIAAAPVVRELLDGDGAWAAEIVRAREMSVADLLVVRMVSDEARVRREAFRCAVGAAAPVGLVEWLRALGTGDVEAQGALKETVRWDAAAVRGALVAGDFSPEVRARLARALRDTADDAAARALLDELLEDPDAGVREAAARAIGRRAREGRGAAAAAVVARVLEAELDRFAAHLDARGDDGFFAGELAVHTRRCLGRILAIAALEGNAPSIRAAGRRLESQVETERRRALDFLQEVTATHPRLLALVERWLVPATNGAPGAGAREAIAKVDPWLSVEPPAAASRVRALRKNPIFAEVPGPELARLAERGTAETSEDALAFPGFFVPRAALLELAETSAELGMGELRALVARLRA